MKLKYKTLSTSFKWLIISLDVENVMSLSPS